MTDLCILAPLVGLEIQTDRQTETEKERESEAIKKTVKVCGCLQEQSMPGRLRDKAQKSSTRNSVHGSVCVDGQVASRGLSGCPR
ncbi:hypothetical protein E2C01_078625 [Portunus trituberculatus]|uniref:Uncharacterized protein n=1 Tax=Portunus trituberculatus TaxID=210409 RepID=A0A5B7IUM2_PORTR|nr:hypothetical protein [Portunus trituberculatus]